MWDKMKPYLYAMPILLGVLLAFLVRSGLQEYNRAMLAEKLMEKQLQIDVIAEQMDQLIAQGDNWHVDYAHYTDSITISMALLDKADMTYAAVFDENLKNLSARSPSYEGSPFMPEEHESFVVAVQKNEKGILIVPFSPADSEERDMYLYYRWMPTDKTLQGRFLAVVAISEYSINTQLSTRFGAVALSAIGITVIINLILVALLGRTGHIYKSRTGDPWRSRRFPND